MKRLIEFAEKIKDGDLKKKTIDILKEQKISNKSMKFPKSDIEKIPSWAGAHHNYEGGLIDHIANVTEIAIAIANSFKKTYKAEINMDHLISGALLHDIMKVFIVKEGGKDLTDTKLDHAVFSACELYARGFPEEVIHIVASHGGETGQPSPRTLEALILYYADTADSAGESMIHGVPSPLQFLLMGGEENEA